MFLLVLLQSHEVSFHSVFRRYLVLLCQIHIILIILILSILFLEELHTAFSHVFCTLFLYHVYTIFPAETLKLHNPDNVSYKLNNRHINYKPGLEQLKNVQGVECLPISFLQRKVELSGKISLGCIMCYLA